MFQHVNSKIMSNANIKAVVNQPFGFYEKSEAVKHLLQPPVGNHLIFGKREQLKVMFVGGPNNRPDYHINEGEELFFQLKGPLDLKIAEHNRPRTVRIEQGQMFCLPARVPHSPQRFANSCGLVIERERLEGETDALRWFIDDSETGLASEEKSAGLEILYEEFFHCFDLGIQLKPVIMKYLDSEPCRTRIPLPGVPMVDPPVVVDNDVNVPMPFLLSEALADLPMNATSALSCLSCQEFIVQVVCGAFDGSLLGTFPNGEVPKEMFAWRVDEGSSVENSSVCRISDASSSPSWTLENGKSCYIRPDLADVISAFNVSQTDGTLLVIYNKIYQPSPNYNGLEEV